MKITQKDITRMRESANKVQDEAIKLHNMAERMKFLPLIDEANKLFDVASGLRAQAEELSKWEE